MNSASVNFKPFADRVCLYCRPSATSKYRSPAVAAVCISAVPIQPVIYPRVKARAANISNISVVLSITLVPVISSIFFICIALSSSSNIITSALFSRTKSASSSILPLPKYVALSICLALAQTCLQPLRLLFAPSFQALLWGHSLMPCRCLSQLKPHAQP